MRKYICDKCGKEMEWNRRNVLNYRYSSFGKVSSYQSGPKYLDICDDCLKTIEDMAQKNKEGYEEEDDADYE